MNTRRLGLLLSFIILLNFWTSLFSWAEGIIVFSYRRATYMMGPNDTIPTRIAEEGISTPSPDGHFLAPIRFSNTPSLYQSR